MPQRLAFLCVLLLTLSTNAFAQEAPVTDCDKYATSDFEPQPKATTVPFANVNPAFAIPACEAAVRHYPNSARLTYQLGRAYHKALNFTAAVEQYRKGAAQNYAPAQNNLGFMYENGLGVPKDIQQATAWYRKAAEQGLPPAQETLRKLSSTSTPPTASDRGAESFAASADDNSWFKNFVVAQGGCTVIEHLNNQIPSYYRDDLEPFQQLFGKPVLKWTDDDIATALSFYRSCEAKNRAARIASCAQAGRLDMNNCAARDTEHDKYFPKFESELRRQITTARNLKNQRITQQQAKEELERTQAAEAEKERQAVETQRRVEEEQRKAAEQQQAIERAIKERQAAEERAAEEKHDAEVRAAERKREVESMPLTAADVQVAVNKVEKFAADYNARKIDASNVEARLEEATRAADEASRLIQTVKDHMTPDDDPATLNLENKIVALRPHLDELRAKIAGIPQEIAQERAEKEKADRLAQEAAEEEADGQRDAKEVGERRLAINTMFDNVLNILNDGEVTVRITDIQINGLRECTESATQNHAAWFNAANRVEDVKKVHPIKLKVGENRRWLSPCRVIFSDITTYQGTTRYKSE